MAVEAPTETPEAPLETKAPETHRGRRPGRAIRGAGDARGAGLRSNPWLRVPLTRRRRRHEVQTYGRPRRPRRRREGQGGR